MAQAKAHTKKAAKKPVSKTAKKHVKQTVAADVQPVTINSRCTANPQTVHLGIGYKTKVQFHCGAGQLFILLMDGGAFIGRPTPFPVIVNGPTFVPNLPLEVAPGANDHIVNYVYDLSGNNCPPIVKDNPPDIIIQN
jgi:hypothetical protein